MDMKKSSCHLQTCLNLARDGLAALIVLEDITWAFSDTRLFTTRAIGNAGLMIDLNEAVLIGHGSGWAGFDTELTANAAHLTDSLDLVAHIL